MDNTVGELPEIVQKGKSNAVLVTLRYTWGFFIIVTICLLYYFEDARRNDKVNSELVNLMFSNKEELKTHLNGEIKDLRTYIDQSNKELRVEFASNLEGLKKSVEAMNARSLEAANKIDFHTQFVNHDSEARLNSLEQRFSALRGEVNLLQRARTQTQSLGE